MSTSESQGCRTVRIRSQRGDTIELPANGTTTMAELRRMLEPALHVPPNRLRLLYSGRILTDDETVDSAGIGEGHIMHVVMVPADAPQSTGRDTAGSSGDRTGPGGMPAGNDLNNFLANLISSSLGGIPGLGGSSSTSITMGFGPPPGAFPGFPTTGTAAGTASGTRGDSAAATGASGASATAQQQQQQQQQNQQQQMSWMVPHLLTSMNTYLQRLQSPDYSPGDVILTSLVTGGGVRDEHLTTLTEALQNILQGVYLPQSLQVLLQQSQTDPVGRLATSPGTNLAAPHAGPASAPPSTTTQPAADGSRQTTTAAGGTGDRGNTSSTTSAGATGGVGTAAGTNSATQTASGTSTGAGGGAARGGATANRPAQAQGVLPTAAGLPRVAYRYTPLAVAALGELVRRADLHIASSLQPQMREMASSLVATAGSRTTTQGTIRSFAAHLNASAALLAELARVASAVAVAVGGDVMPLAVNTAAVIQPNGSGPALPRLLPRTHMAMGDSNSHQEDQGAFGQGYGGLGMYGGGIPNFGSMGMPAMIPGGMSSITLDMGELPNMNQMGPMIQNMLGMAPGGSTPGRPGSRTEQRRSRSQTGRRQGDASNTTTTAGTTTNAAATAANARAASQPAATAAATTAQPASETSAMNTSAAAFIPNASAQSNAAAPPTGNSSNASSANVSKATDGSSGKRTAAGSTSNSTGNNTASQTSQSVQQQTSATQSQATGTPSKPNLNLSTPTVVYSSGQTEPNQATGETSTAADQSPAASKPAPRGLGLQLGAKKKTAPLSDVSAGKKALEMLMGQAAADKGSTSGSKQETGSKSGGEATGTGTTTSSNDVTRPRGSNAANPLAEMMRGMMAGSAGSGAGSGPGGGMGGLLQMATQIASDPNMSPVIEQTLSSLLGGGGSRNGPGAGLGGLLGSFMGGMPAPQQTSTGRAPPISGNVIDEALSNDAAAAERWRTTLAADVTAQEVRPTRDAELEGGEAYEAIQSARNGLGGSGVLGSLLGNL